MNLNTKTPCEERSVQEVKYCYLAGMNPFSTEAIRELRRSVQDAFGIRSTYAARKLCGAMVYATVDSWRQWETGYSVPQMHKWELANAKLRHLLRVIEAGDSLENDPLYTRYREEVIKATETKPRKKSS